MNQQGAMDGWSVSDLLKPLEQSAQQYIDPLKDWAADVLGADKVALIDAEVNKQLEEQRKEAQSSLFNQTLQILGIKTTDQAATGTTASGVVQTLQQNPFVQAIGGARGLMLIGGVAGAYLLWRVLRK